MADDTRPPTPGPGDELPPPAWPSRDQAPPDDGTGDKPHGGTGTGSAAAPGGGQWSPVGSAGRDVADRPPPSWPASPDPAPAPDAPPATDPPATGPRGDRSPGRRVALWVFVGLLLAVGVVLAGVVSSDDEATPVVTASEPVADRSATGPDALDDEASRPFVAFGDGTLEVGTDVQPGTYRGGTSGSCIWFRLRSLDSTVDDALIANGVAPVGASTIVTIRPDDLGFESSDCGGWAPLEDTLADEPTDRIEPGTYVVGDEVTPGAYLTSGGESCFWGRLADFTWGVDGVLGFGDTSGPGARGVVQIDASDRGFFTTGCETWVPLGNVEPSGPPATTVGDGLWFVGTDVEPGTWRTDGPGEFCYWETVSDFSAGFDAIIDNGLGDESTVTITDEAVAFQTSECGTWTRQ